MALPPVKYRHRSVPDKAMSLSAAAGLTGLAPANLQKLVAAGYVELRGPHIVGLAQEPFITAGKTLPVLRTEVAAEDGTWRPYSGDALWLSDEDWLLAHSDVVSDEFQASGYLAVGLGGMITGVARINGVTAAPDGTERLDLALVGRLIGFLKDGVLSFGERLARDEQAFVRKVVGFRYEPGTEPITWI